VGVDGESAGGLGVCTSVNDCVSEGDGGCAIDGDQDAVHFYLVIDLAGRWGRLGGTGGSELGRQV
jgi:hypothetical protein